MTPIGPIEAAFWSYVRGDFVESDFEAWAYREPRLDALLGEKDWIELVSLNFKDSSSSARFDRLSKVRGLARRHFPRVCDCQAAPGFFRRSIGCSQIEKCPVVSRRTPWIALHRCEDCGTRWMVGVDTVEDDTSHVRVSSETAGRIAGEDRWPSDFDEMKNIWPDDSWLKSMGFESLDGWRALHDPAWHRTIGFSPLTKRD